MLPHLALLAALACPVPQPSSDALQFMRPPPLELSTRTLLLEEWDVTAKQRDKMIAAAVSAVHARQDGKATYTQGGQVQHLDEGGLCARAVRQWAEVGSGLPAYGWAYRGADAREVCRKLAKAGLRVHGTPEPGDVICWPEGHGPYGHIALFVGAVDGKPGLIAENSSAKRGDPRKPGTKFTKLGNVAQDFEVYRLGPS
jgi:hypothetical protein